jgi:hypothetical protein
MATCLAETILATAATSGFTKLSEEEKLYVMLQSIYEASGSSDDLDTLMEAAKTAGFSKIASERYKACILLQLMVSKNATTTAASDILAASALSQFMFLSEGDKKSAFLQLMCDINDVDPAAADFFTRADITDGDQMAAVNQLVLDLRAASLWDKMHIIYPFVGGTAAKHAFNLKADSFQITNAEWTTGVTHNAEGVRGDGLTGFGNTGYLPSDESIQNSTHLSYYIQDLTGATGTSALAGCLDNPVKARLTTYIDTTTKMYSNIHQPTYSNAYFVTTAVGNFLSSRTAATVNIHYINATTGATDPQPSASPQSQYPLYVLARNSFTGAGNFCKARLA